MRALQVYMVDMIATEYEAKCSALNVVVNAQADARGGAARVATGTRQAVRQAV